VDTLGQPLDPARQRIMPFQFLCPQGHLLEGDESQAGQQCHCPTCGVLFIIPQRIAAPTAEGGDPTQVAGSVQLSVPEGDPSAPYVPEEDPTAKLQSELLHIPCPKGHKLETPVEMLDQDVLCPQCNTRFRLRRKDSVEHKQQVEREESRRLEKAGNLWLNLAITAVVLIVLALLGLIALSSMDQSAPLAK
jgi:rubredoxin